MYSKCYLFLLQKSFSCDYSSEDQSHFSSQHSIVISCLLCYYSIAVAAFYFEYFTKYVITFNLFNVAARFLHILRKQNCAKIILWLLDGFPLLVYADKYLVALCCCSFSYLCGRRNRKWIVMSYTIVSCVLKDLNW